MITRQVLPHEIFFEKNTPQEIELLSRLVGIHWVLPLPDGVIKIAPTTYTQPKWQQAAQEWVGTLGLPSYKILM